MDRKTLKSSRYAQKQSGRGIELLDFFARKRREAIGQSAHSRRASLEEKLSTLWSRLDPHDPRIPGISSAFNEAGRLEGLNKFCHRRRLHLLCAREIAER